MAFLKDDWLMAWKNGFKASEQTQNPAKPVEVKTHGSCMTRGKMLFSHTKMIIRVMFFINIGS